MKILVTGFEPFGGERLNPSAETVMRLRAPENTELVKKILPVEYETVRKMLPAFLDEIRPDVVLHVGQAGGRTAITPELAALNFQTTRSMDGRTFIKDNAGLSVDDSPIDPSYPPAYFSTLPIREMVNVIQDTGNPAAISYSAGAFLCNYTMFLSLHYAAKKAPATKSGFLHIPYLPEQVENRPDRPFSLPLDEMVVSLQAVVDLLAQYPAL